MELEQIKVAQNMQKLFITSLKLSKLKIRLILSALFISNEMCSPYYHIEKISIVIVVKTNAIFNITLKSSKSPLYLVFLLIFFHHYEVDFVINAK